MANTLNKITTKSILDATVATADIADDAVTLAKMAGGTDGQIITYDASGDPVAVGPGTDGQVLTSTGAGSPPAFEAIPTQISLANDANNRVITGTGSGLNGEANLTFDGELLTVTHDGTGTPENQIVLHTSAVDVGGGSGIFLKASSSTTANRYGARIHTVREANGATQLVFSTELTGGTTGLQEALKISSNKNVTVSDGDLVIGTSGHGIDFSATSDGSGTDTSELLDDYEEGTFTPTMSYHAGSSSIAYSLQQGQYTKIGNTVFFHLRINLSNKGSSSGNHVIFEGLPYTPSTSTISNSMMKFDAVQGVVMGDDGLMPFCQVQGTAKFYLYTFDYGGAGDYAEFTISNLTNTSQMSVSGHYYI